MGHSSIKMLPFVSQSLNRNWNNFTDLYGEVEILRKSSRYWISGVNGIWRGKTQIRLRYISDYVEWHGVDFTFPITSLNSSFNGVKDSIWDYRIFLNKSTNPGRPFLPVMSSNRRRTMTIETPIIRINLLYPLFHYLNQDRME